MASSSSSSSARGRGSSRRGRGGGAAATTARKAGKRSAGLRPPPSDCIDDFHAEAALARALAEAERLIGRADHAAALSLLQPLVAQHASNAALHDVLAQCRLAEGDVRTATVHLRAACELGQGQAQSDGSAERWMELAQCSAGLDAVAAFARGAALFAAQRDALLLRAPVDDAAVWVMRAALSTAFVSMAELYVTECCDEADAEERCEALLADALREWPRNPDALYARANLRLIQGRTADARSGLGHAISALEETEEHDSARAPALSVLSASATVRSSSESSASASSYELRLNLAKMAYELGDARACAGLLERCLEEDDRFIEVHHLAALAHLQLGQRSDAAERARSALSMARHLQQEDATAPLANSTAALTALLELCGVDGEDDADDEERPPRGLEAEDADSEAEESAEDNGEETPAAMRDG